MSITYHPYKILNIGTTAKSLGFYGVRPVAKQSSPADPTSSAATNATTIAKIIDILEAYGLSA